jgi:hypothetical protein
LPVPSKVKVSRVPWLLGASVKATVLGDAQVLDLTVGAIFVRHEEIAAPSRAVDWSDQHVVPTGYRCSWEDGSLVPFDGYAELFDFVAERLAFSRQTLTRGASGSQSDGPASGPAVRLDECEDLVFFDVCRTLDIDEELVFPLWTPRLDFGGSIPVPRGAGEQAQEGREAVLGVLAQNGLGQTRQSREAYLRLTGCRPVGGLIDAVQSTVARWAGRVNAEWREEEEEEEEEEAGDASGSV